MKKITLENLAKQYKIQEYTVLYETVLKLIDRNKLKPVVASGINGKKPALYCSYWILEEEKDYAEYEKELKYEMCPMIHTDYYLQHMERYREDREWVLRLNQYLKENKTDLLYDISINERSFAIWQREKFLKQEQGKKVLNRCGIKLEDMGIYETSEPISYYVHDRNVPQNILVIENKDTFYTLRKYMLAGNHKILGVEFGTIIYGAGKGVLKSFRDLEKSGEPYMLDAGNQIHYFGDMDYEGVIIYESFVREFGKMYKIRPFEKAYEKMLEKAVPERLPEMKKGQNHNVTQDFFSHFKDESQQKMKIILEKEMYIPQEIINRMDLEKE